MFYAISFLCVVLISMIFITWILLRIAKSNKVILFTAVICGFLAFGAIWYTILPLFSCVHEYEVTDSKAPTYDDKGYIEYYCDLCDSKKSVNIDKLKLSPKVTIYKYETNTEIRIEK